PEFEIYLRTNKSFMPLSIPTEAPPTSSASSRISLLARQAPKPLTSQVLRYFTRVRISCTHLVVPQSVCVCRNASIGPYFPDRGTLGDMGYLPSFSSICTPAHPLHNLPSPLPRPSHPTLQPAPAATA